MPYVVPAMPLLVHVWHAYDPAVSAYGSPDILSVHANLSPGKRTFQAIDIVPSSPVTGFAMELLVPALTDIRAASDVALADLIECPKASQRFYLVRYVDDIGKGFANEHRFVLMVMFDKQVDFTDANLPFPVPMP